MKKINYKLNDIKTYATFLDGHLVVDFMHLWNDNPIDYGQEAFDQYNIDLNSTAETYDVFVAGEEHSYGLGRTVWIELNADGVWDATRDDIINSTKKQLSEFLANDGAFQVFDLDERQYMIILFEYHDINDFDDNGIMSLKPDVYEYQFKYIFIDKNNIYKDKLNYYDEKYGYLMDDY